MTERDDDDGAMLPVAEERLTVGKRRVVTDRVRLKVMTETRDEAVTAEVLGERVEVTRVPVDREVDAVPQLRVEGDVTIVPVVDEVLVVERRLVLREEVHLRRVPFAEAVETLVPLRRQHVVIERDGDVPSFPPTSEDGSDDRL